MKPHRPSTRGKASVGSRETEVKLPVADLAEIRRRLVRLQAVPQGVRVHETNILYDTPEGILRGSGRLLRIRIAHPATAAGKSKRKADAKKAPSAALASALLTYKGQVQRNALSSSPVDPRYKICDERECPVEDPDAIAAIFQGIGLVPSFRYEKYRSTFGLPGLPGLKVELDETPIGDFVELEGRGESIDRAAKLLGFQSSDYITRSYPALYVEHVSRQPAGTKPGKSPAGDDGNMVFPEPD